MKIEIAKAGYFEHQPISDVEIKITGSAPKFQRSEDLWNFYIEQAQTISKTLLESLPKGTAEQLIKILASDYDELIKNGEQ
jgi:hypothetical protein